MVADALLYYQPPDYSVPPRQPCPQGRYGSQFAGGHTTHTTPRFTMWRPILGYENVDVPALPSQPVTNALIDPCYVPEGMITQPMHFPNIVTGFERNPASAARSALYPRYTSYEWNQYNTRHYNESNTVRNYSQRLKHETVRIMRETDETVSGGQIESGRRIGERMSDLAFWRNEGVAELPRLLYETDQLQEKRRYLEMAIQDIEGPLHITQECLSLREQRIGIDLVHDGAEEALMKEVEILRFYREELMCLREKIVEQARNNRATQHEIERDIKSKEEALSIDKMGHNLNNFSGGLAYYGGIENFLITYTTPETWADNSNITIQRVQKERVKSAQLRSDVDNLIDRCAKDIWNAWDKTNVALANTFGTQEAKRQLTIHLHQVQDELFQVEKYMELLRKAIEDKTNPLKVAHTRLEVRSHRRDVEKCLDAGQSRILREVKDISCSIETLHRSLQACEAQHQQILKTRSNLEISVQIKANTLYIDQEKCLGMRRSYPIRSMIKH